FGGQVHGRASAVAMAHNGGAPRLPAKRGSAVEVLDKQQIEDPALARVKRARTSGHRDSLPAMAPHSSRHLRASRPGDAYARSRTLNHLWGHRKLEPNNRAPAPLKVDITNLGMFAAAGVRPQHVAVITIPGGVAARATQSLAPVGRQPLDMLRFILRRPQRCSHRSGSGPRSRRSGQVCAPFQGQERLDRTSRYPSGSAMVTPHRSQYGLRAATRVPPASTRRRTMFSSISPPA
ncbi:MAG: hypothetical protein JWL68_2483, partial [Actinomycetia bacterium]|nr:hypothetical protein [Actinomycetes bacterium]